MRLCCVSNAILKMMVCIICMTAVGKLQLARHPWTTNYLHSQSEVFLGAKQMESWSRHMSCCMSTAAYGKWSYLNCRISTTCFFHFSSKLSKQNEVYTKSQTQWFKIHMYWILLCGSVRCTHVACFRTKSKTHTHSRHKRTMNVVRKKEIYNKCNYVNVSQSAFHKFSNCVFWKIESPIRNSRFEPKMNRKITMKCSFCFVRFSHRYRWGFLCSSEKKNIHTHTHPIRFLFFFSLFLMYGVPSALGTMSDRANRSEPIWKSISFYSMVHVDTCVPCPTFLPFSSPSPCFKVFFTFHFRSRVALLYPMYSHFDDGFRDFSKYTFTSSCATSERKAS